MRSTPDDALPQLPESDQREIAPVDDRAPPRPLALAGAVIAAVHHFDTNRTLTGPLLNPALSLGPIPTDKRRP